MTERGEANWSLKSPVELCSIESVTKTEEHIYSILHKIMRKMIFLTDRVNSHHFSVSLYVFVFPSLFKKKIYLLFIHL